MYTQLDGFKYCYCLHTVEWFQAEELYCELNYYDQKIQPTPTHDIRGTLDSCFYFISLGLVCDMDCCRVSALQSVIADSISSGGDHHIHY